MILEAVVLALGISSVVSYETTGKGLGDHAISAYRDKDCKIARSVHGEDICQPKGTVTVSAPTEPITPVAPETPQPKKIVVVSNSVDEMERIMSLRRTQR